MKAEVFRALALALPGVVEGAHQGHADFRVAGRIFATLGPGQAWGMVKLTAEGQAARANEHPTAFEPFPGAWGRQGCTRVLLAEAGEAAVRQALVEAWRRTAPQRLLDSLDEGAG